jgi:hypothetical protein
MVIPEFLRGAGNLGVDVDIDIVVDDNTHRLQKARKSG